MATISQRLRERAAAITRDGGSKPDAELMDEAAKEIDRLETEVDNWQDGMGEALDRAAER